MCPLSDSFSANNVGEYLFSAPIDNFNIWQDWGRPDDDLRHRIVMSGTAQSHGFHLTAMLQYCSTLPFNMTTGASTIQGTPARPIANGSFIPETQAKVRPLQHQPSPEPDLSPDQRLRMEAIGEMLNVTNHVNRVALNGTFGPAACPTAPLPSFRQATSVAKPQSGQIGLRLTF